VMGAGLQRMTAQSITESAPLIRELNEIAERGYATELSENISGVVSVAAPILDQSRMPVGAIGVSAMASETSPVNMRQWGKDCVRTAAQISHELGKCEARDKEGTEIGGMGAGGQRFVP